MDKKINIENDFLSNLLAEIEQEEIKELGIEEEQEEFRITNDDQAEYFIKKYKSILSQKEEIHKTATDYINKVIEKTTNWQTKENNKLDNNLNRINFLLEQYAKEKLKDSNAKSVKLIEGSIGFAKQQDKYEYDEKQILGYLQSIESKEYFKPIKLEINKTALKRAGRLNEDGQFTLNGIVVPGINVIKGEDKFRIG